MNQFRSKPILTALIIILLIVLTCIMIHFKQLATPTQKMMSEKIHLSTQPTAAHHTNTNTTEQQTVKQGDNLTTILNQQGLAPKTIKRIVYQTTFSKQLPPLNIGDQFQFHYKNHHLSSISFRLKNNKTLYLALDKKNKVYTKTTPATLISEMKQGVITTNFNESALKAGLNHNLIKQFTHLFQGKINFSKNVAPNDHFSVLYQEYVINGKNDHSGDILMAEYQHRDKTYTAIRFKAPGQKAFYYDWHGHGLEPLFLKAPLKYKRISSKFSYRRLDPILHKYRPHYGVDYAAPIGTPIHSIGDGVIVFKGKDGGYGNVVKVRYSKKLLGLYAHMSRFAKVHKGEKVKRGQTIGYVGQTGWATGPHLHFGWYVNGIPRDPLKRKVFYNPPISKKNRALFFSTLHQLQTKWNLLKIHHSL